MAKLKCVGRYANDPRNLRFEVGQVFEPTEELRDFLMVDAPGCFEEVRATKRKAVKAPPKNKAVQEPEVSK